MSYSAAERAVRRHRGSTTELVGDDIFESLEAEISSGPSEAVWAGYFGYACRPDLPARPSTGVPDAIWMRPSRFRAIRPPPHVPSSPELGTENAARPVAPTPDWYSAAFSAVQEALYSGDSYEVNLTYRTTVESDRDPVSTYLRMVAHSPAPRAAFMQHDVPEARSWLLSTSPESYVRIDATGGVEARPIKGTTPRSPDPTVDRAAAAALREQTRYRAENLMIVDLLRDDLARICEPASVHVPALMEVESYTSVHQLVSTVRGRLRGGLSAVSAVRALFPAGSMTGAPRLRTMSIVDAVESTARGAYAGAFGTICADGTADLGVVIRSASGQGEGTWELGSGGGITVHSDVDEEWAESVWKLDRLVRAISY